MKRKHHTEEQIIGVLKEHAAGASIADLLRRHSVCENTIYRRKSNYGGMRVSEARRLREVDTENQRLKRLLADAELVKAALKGLVAGMPGKAAQAQW